MSRSKDHHGGARGRIVRVTERAPCPVCGRRKACGVAADGTVFCTVQQSEVPCRDGVMRTWIHRVDTTRAAAFIATAPPEVPTAERADLEGLDRSYRALLAELSLSPAHEEQLRTSRGLSPEQIRAGMFRTWPFEGRARVARRWVERVGEPLARMTPGYRVAEADGRSWATLAGAAGLVVPCVDSACMLGAIKTRRDGAGDGPRYSYVSSAKHGGPKALQLVHVPPGFDGDRATVRVTEGELKATVATALTNTLTVSVPGVGAWRLVLPVLHQIGARRVLVAFDADHRTNPEVGRALHGLVQTLRRDAYTVGVEVWDARLGKGIDDVLLRGRATEAA